MENQEARSLMDFAIEQAMKGDPEVIRKALDVARAATEYVSALRSVADMEAHQVAGPDLQGFKLCRAWVEQGDTDPELQHRINLICDSQSVLTIDRMIKSLDYAIMMVPGQETGSKGIRELLEAFLLVYKQKGRRRGGPEEYDAVAAWVKSITDNDPDMTWAVSTMIKSQSVVTMDQLLHSLRATADQLDLVLATRKDLDSL